MKEKVIFVTSCFLLALMPVGVQVEDDSTETNIEFMASTGQYAFIARGCDDEVLYKQPLPLQEINAAVDYKTKSPVRVGLKASYLHTEIEDDDNYQYDYQTGERFYEFNPTNGLALTPFLYLESETFTLGGGAVWSNNSIPIAGDVTTKWLPSGYIRFGNVQRFYFDISLFHATPLISGNYINMGIGSGKNPELEWWIGTGFLPYENLGLIGKTYIPINQLTAVKIFARVGRTEGVLDGAIGIGLRYRY